MMAMAMGKTMNTASNEWMNTSTAVTELTSLLKCSLCCRLVNRPCTLGSCDHFFCQGCVEDKLLGEMCPVCGVPSHAKEMQPNKQLATAVLLCRQLERLLQGDIGSSTVNSTTTLDHVLTETTEKDLLHQQKISTPPISVKNKLLSRLASPPAGSPIGRRTRKAAAVKQKAQFFKKTNKNWGIGEEEEESVCGSCTRDNNNIGRKVRFNSRRGGSMSDNSSTTEVVKKEIVDADMPHSKLPAQSANEEMKVCPSTSIVESEISGDTNVRKSSRKRTSSAKTEQDLQQVATRVLRKRTSSCEQSAGEANDNEVDGITGPTVALLHKKPSTRDNNVKKETRKRSPRGHSGKLPVRHVSPKADLDYNSTLSVNNLLSSSPKVTSTTNRAACMTTPKSSSRPGGTCDTSQNSSLMSSPRSSTPAHVKKNAKGETMLQVATIKGDLIKVRDLLEQGASVNVKDHAGWTPLHEACNHGYLKIVELLLDNGAFINIPGMNNETPLHDAVENGKINVVRLLVSRGASLSARNIYGKTPAQLATTDDMKKAMNVPIDQDKLTFTKTEPISNDRVAILCSKLTRDQKSRVEKVTRALHGKILTDFTDEVTHVVTDVSAQGTCGRTLKFMEAVLRGLWIVTVDWVETCEEYKEWVSGEPFEISGTSSSPSSNAPCRARMNMIQQLPGLFDGCHFAFMGQYEYPSPGKDELVRLVKLGGATVLSREPREELINQERVIVPYHAEKGSCLESCSNFVIHDKDIQLLGLKGVRLCHTNVAWLLDSIAEFKLCTPPTS